MKQVARLAHFRTARVTLLVAGPDLHDQEMDG